MQAIQPLREMRPRPADIASGRRWFSSPAADLYLWSDDNGRPTAFEFCYDKLRDEHSLRWRRHGGMDHVRIDAGESEPRRNASPIATADGDSDLLRIAQRFESLAGGIDPRVFRFVLVRLFENL